MSYYNYEDYKSEEEQIVDEAVSQITGLIREKAKQELNDVQYRLEYYKKETELLKASRDKAFKERDAAQNELEDYKKQVANNETLKNAIPFKVGDKTGFVLSHKKDYDLIAYSNEFYEVIGNINDNPELLEEHNV